MALYPPASLEDIGPFLTKDQRFSAMGADERQLNGSEKEPAKWQAIFRVPSVKNSNSA